MSGEFEQRLASARMLAAAGRGPEAREALDALLDEDSEHAGAMVLKATLLRQSGAVDAALAVCERAARVAPTSALAWNEQALCLHTLGRHDEALEAARRARELMERPEPGLHAAQVYLTLIWCLREKRLYREALEAAEECLARSPDAVIAEWANQLEQELAEAERERC